jgi:hypothetical protein
MLISFVFIWFGERLFQNNSLLIKVAGGILWICGYLYMIALMYAAFGRLAWRTKLFGFLRSFFPPQ